MIVQKKITSEFFFLVFLDSFKKYSNKKISSKSFLSQSLKKEQIKIQKTKTSKSDKIMKNFIVLKI